MFNVTIKFNPNNENIREDVLMRRAKARKEFFDELVFNGFIEELKEEEEGYVSFRVSYGGTRQFLDKLPELIYQFRSVDKKSKIMLEAMTTV